MSKIALDDDPFSRKVTRALLWLQLSAMLIVVGCILFNLFSLALMMSFLTFIVLIAIFIWLYFRYQKIPVVQEKRNLEQKHLDLQKRIRAEGMKVQSTKKKREEFFQAEKNETASSLKTLQHNYIQNGLANNFIKDATIPGIGPKLKERLAGYGITSAAQVTARVSEVPGFGEAKRQALMSWRSLILARLDSAKPSKLPREQLEGIKQKHQALHQKNDVAEQNAQINEQKLKNDLSSVSSRLQQLTGITFVAYISKSLAPRGIVAAVVAFLLVITQLVSSVSATGSAIIASIPTATLTSTVTSTFTQTSTPTNTFTPTITDTPTITLTPTITNTPTLTFTATATNTPRPTFTLRPKNTPTTVPSSGGGGGTGNCHPSYPGVCIPPPPPDLNCPQISYRRFQVLPPDPHNFDRDGDGIGCES